jgi:hypothetical protein
LEKVVGAGNRTGPSAVSEGIRGGIHVLHAGLKKGLPGTPLALLHQVQAAAGFGQMSDAAADDIMGLHIPAKSNTRLRRRRSPVVRQK